MDIIADILVPVLAILAGGGGASAYYIQKRMRRIELATSQQEANDQTMLSFYAMWNEELRRLRIEIDKLHALVAALEGEIIALGGDPVRVRLQLAKDMRNG
ncbi:MAG TPA: hypothetical protein V6D20_18555 [Candidatus Obscuribacterales bacterium]